MRRGALRRHLRRFARTDRAVTPTAGKALELGVVVLYVSLLVSSLYGGALPAYRAAAGDELADRTLAAAADRVESAVPSDAVRARRTVELDLPRTIRGANYRLRVANRTLVLDHPHPDVGGRTRLVLPGDATVAGTVSSGDDAVVAVRSNATAAEITLEASA